MSPFAIASVVFGCSFGVAVAGMLARLPDHHRDPDSKDAVKLVMGLIATMAALVLSLLIASANNSYNAQRSELDSLSANIILLDRLLVFYGLEAKEARDRLRDAVVAAHDRIWSPHGVQPPDFGTSTRFVEQLQSLSPKTDTERSMRGQAMQVSENIMHTRLLMLEQLGGSISWPFLTVLIFWICVLFFGFGLFARFNLTVTIALLVGALSVSGAIFLILELNEPFRGIMRISDAPLRNALSQIDR
jgi:Protein of unknown function (DUF4239)